MKKIAISGSSGFAGKKLTSYLQSKGHFVKPIKRFDYSDLESFDAIIHLSGENIARKRWSESFKKTLESSRVDTTKQLTQVLSKLQNPPKTFLVASAIGFYGDRGNEALDETSSKGTTFFSSLAENWAKAAQSPPLKNTKTVFMRFGIILDKNDGALKKMLIPFKFFLGAVMGNGKQYLSFIAIDDLLRAILFVIENNQISGPINFTAPNPVTNEEFTKILAKKVHRPAFLKIPKWLINLVFGQMGQALFLDSLRVYPKALLNWGFKFEYPDLESALTHILCKKE
jgi:uncharacterized protein (TIGR01777 family)